MAALLAGLLVIVLAIAVAGARMAWVTREAAFQRELEAMQDARDRAQARADQVEAALDDIRGRALNIGIPAKRDAGELPAPPLPAEVETFLAGIEEQEAREEFREVARALVAANPRADGPTLLSELIS